MTPAERAEEWITLRFPVGSRVKLPDVVPPGRDDLNIVSDMLPLFGSGRTFKVIGYRAMAGDPYWALILDTANDCNGNNRAFLTSWVIKDAPILEHAKSPVLESVPESKPAVSPAPPSGEISWGAAMVTPLAALLGLVAAKKTINHFSKSAPVKVVQQQEQAVYKNGK